MPAPSTERQGTIAFTATRWGTLLDRRFVPEDEALPRAADCYRFAMTNTNVDVCLSGAKNAVDGPLDAVELERKRVLIA